MNHQGRTERDLDLAADRVTILAKAISNRNPEGRVFGILERDRFAHLYLIGRTGTGKSTLLRFIAEQDIRNGYGLAVFDPHGDLVRELRMSAQASGRMVLFLDAHRADWRFNPLAVPEGSDRALVAAGLVESFRKLWADSWGPRLEHLLRNVVLTLLDAPRPSLGDVPRLLTEKAFRERAVSHVADRVVQRFWTGEFAGYSPGMRSVVTAPLLNKVGALLTDPRLRAILASGESGFDLAGIMNRGDVLLVDLSKGRVGEGPAALLGALLVSQIALTGLARTNQPEAERTPFFVVLDEFHVFTTHVVATMLSELRKYRVGLLLAHQYLTQLDQEVRDAVLGNAGTMICFRVGAADASLLAREFQPVFSVEDLLKLPNYHVYLKLMVRGEVTNPFSAATLKTTTGQPARS